MRPQGSRYQQKGPSHPFCLISLFGPLRPYHTITPYCPAVPKHREMGQWDTGHYFVTCQPRCCGSSRKETKET